MLCPFHDQQPGPVLTMNASACTRIQDGTRLQTKVLDDNLALIMTPTHTHTHTQHATGPALDAGGVGIAERCLAIPIGPVSVHALQIYLECDEAATTPVVVIIEDSYWGCYAHIKMRTSLVCSQGPGRPTLPPGGHTRPVSKPLSLSTSLTSWPAVVPRSNTGILGD